ncbi:hypothetical protein IGI04_029985 [Brassica rapa subsp. trilocularis]|uniref:Uncharacterized protein n=1 Tax=Brassica rapa subsp. trilocularis TaxID=1813537 RepID=A0ABQ7LPE2_BRACM|nr:hypothetical protein IGI04_029985 [Brassica rapa subsp. trilocularis]
MHMAFFLQEVTLHSNDTSVLICLAVVSRIYHNDSRSLRASTLSSIYVSPYNHNQHNHTFTVYAIRENVFFGTQPQTCSINQTTRCDIEPGLLTASSSHQANASNKWDDEPNPAGLEEEGNSC